MVLESHFEAPLSTILDVTPLKGTGSKEIKSSLNSFLHLPEGSTQY